jgi:uncharacterized protein DUF3489
MNASEKQSPNKPAEDKVTKGRAARPGASKVRAKSVRRPSKPKRRSKATTGTRRGTKTAKILALLRRPAGASLSELKKATGWQAHSVRGFLSGAVKKKMGLRIDSAPRDNGERAYRVASK